MEKPKRGTVREDGKVFEGIKSNGRERWISPEAWERLKERKRLNEKGRVRKGRIQKYDPELGKKRRAEFFERHPEKRGPFYGQGIGSHPRKRQTKEQERAKTNARTRGRLQTDPLFKLKFTTRNRLGNAIRKIKNQKTCRTLGAIGCTWEFLKVHIESQFSEGMTWDNHGFDGWHIDHIKPLAMAKTQEQLLPLLHFSNLQPLWKKDNFSKGTKFEIHP